MAQNTTTSNSRKIFFPTGYLLVERTAIGTVVSGSVDRETGEKYIREQLGWQGEIPWKKDSWTGIDSLQFLLIN